MLHYLPPDGLPVYRDSAPNLESQAAVFANDVLSENIPGLISQV